MSYWSIVLFGRDVPLSLVDAVGQTTFVAVLMVAVFLATALQFFTVNELYGSGDSVTPEEQTNCPACGARIATEADTCEYCNEPVGR